MPHLVGFGYAEQAQGHLILRWKGGERAPLPKVGEDIASEARVAAVLKEAPSSEREPTLSCMADGHQLLMLFAVASKSSPVIRGYVVGWIDLDTLCRDAAVPLLHDQVLAATPLEAHAPTPADARRVTMHDGGVTWDAAIVRGPRFSDRYAPTPWLAYIAAGMSAVPLLILAMLAGRAARLHGALVTERESVRQQRYFTQSVSHEFRTPLGIILSGADLLESYDQQITDERRREVLGEIKANTRHMNAMIEQVLLLGRIESSRLMCNPKPIHVADFCRDIVHRVNTATHGRCAIAVAAPEREAMLDAALLGSVLGNLLSNAVKYSAPGQSVALETREDGAAMVFVVRDEGIGIPAEDVPRVGELFHRSSNVGDAPGTGLGLTIAQRCTELMGGSLKIASEAGRGTTVTVNIPNPDGAK